MGAMILGALPFTFHYAFVRKKFLSPKLGKEVLAYFAILGGATLIFAAISGLDPMQSAFYSVSASTTAGLQIESLAGPKRRGTYNSNHPDVHWRMWIFNCRRFENF